MDLWDFAYLYLLPLVGFFWAGCDCCGGAPPDCTVLADTFDRANSTNLGSDWTETTGDSTIDTNRLKFTTTSAKATCNTDSPTAARVITVKAYGSTANNLARIWCGDWIIEIKFSTTAGSVKIIDSGGTTRSTSATNLNVGLSTDLPVSICYDGSTLEAELDGIDNSYVYYPASISDLTNGLGTGATVSGSVQFNDWDLQLLDGDCPCPLVLAGGDQGCSNCTSTVAAYYWMVDVSGVTNSGTCTSCSNYDRSYILTPTGASTCIGSDPTAQVCCYISAPIPIGVTCSTAPTGPHSARLSLAIVRNFLGFTGFSVRTGWSTTGGIPTFRQTETYQWDCVSRSAYSLAYDSGSPAVCDFSGATVTITSL